MASSPEQELEGQTDSHVSPGQQQVSSLCPRLIAARISPVLIDHSPDSEDSTPVSINRSPDSEDSIDGNVMSRKGKTFKLNHEMERHPSSQPDSDATDSAHASGDVIQTFDVIQVMKANTMYMDDRTYKMSAKVRGMCIIVNNILFQDPSFNRPGSDRDGQGLAAVFEQLSFVVHTYVNLTSYDMEKVFNEASEKQSRQYDCFVAIILTHGWKQNLLYGVDNGYVSLDNIISKFNNQNCKELIGKPKLFFIQACRGEQFDSGVNSSLLMNVADAVGFVDTDVETNKLPLTIPTWSDTVICFSTIDGYVSLRNTTTGSWFGDALIKVLCSNACQTELHELLTLVNEKLMKREGSSMLKQSMEIVYRGWSKKLYFNPGHFLEIEET